MKYYSFKDGLIFQKPISSLHHFHKKILLFIERQASTSQPVVEKQRIAVNVKRKFSNRKDEQLFQSVF